MASYQFVTGSEQHRSEGYWLHPNGQIISQGNRFIPSVNEEGFEIKFCVKSFAIGSQIESTTLCSSGILIRPKHIKATPTISIANASTNATVGSIFSAIALNDYDYQAHYQWYVNRLLIPDQTTRHLNLTRLMQGKRIHVCLTEDKSQKILACSEQSNFIQPRKGAAPDVNLAALPDHIQVGDSLSISAEYSDSDSDQENVSKRTYHWYLDNKLAAATQDFVIPQTAALKPVKACVTVYAETGLPDVSEVTCSRNQTVWQRTASNPTVNSIDISGIAMLNQKIKASYQYFDANNDAEGNSVSGWYANNQQIADTAEVTLSRALLNGQDSIQFCVTPVDDKNNSGDRHCKTQQLASITLKGDLTNNGVLMPQLSHYPEFDQSWWQAAHPDNKITFFHSVGKNKVKNWSGKDYRLSIINNFRELQFCVQAKTLDGKVVDLCETLSRDHGLEQGMEIDANNYQRIAYDPQRIITTSISGSEEKVYRPISAAEYARAAKSLNLASATEVDYDAGLISDGLQVKGIAMTAADALAYCQRTLPLGRVASRKAMNDVFTVEKLGYVLWPNPHDHEWLATDDNGRLVLLSEFQQFNKDKKYRFNCASD